MSGNRYQQGNNNNNPGRHGPYPGGPGGNYGVNQMEEDMYYQGGGGRPQPRGGNPNNQQQYYGGGMHNQSPDGNRRQPPGPGGYQPKQGGQMGGPYGQYGQPQPNQPYGMGPQRGGQNMGGPRGNQPMMGQQGYYQQDMGPMDDQRMYGGPQGSGRGGYNGPMGPRNNMGGNQGAGPNNGGGNQNQRLYNPMGGPQNMPHHQGQGGMQQMHPRGGYPMGGMGYEEGNYRGGPQQGQRGSQQEGQQGYNQQGGNQNQKGNQNNRKNNQRNNQHNNNNNNNNNPQQGYGPQGGNQRPQPPSQGYPGQQPQGGPSAPMNIPPQQGNDFGGNMGNLGAVQQAGSEDVLTSQNELTLKKYNTLDRGTYFTDQNNKSIKFIIDGEEDFLGWHDDYLINGYLLYGVVIKVTTLTSRVYLFIEKEHEIYQKYLSIENGRTEWKNLQTPREFHIATISSVEKVEIYDNSEDGFEGFVCYTVNEDSRLTFNTDQAAVEEWMTLQSAILLFEPTSIKKIFLDILHNWLHQPESTKFQGKSVAAILNPKVPGETVTYSNQPKFIQFLDGEFFTGIIAIQYGKYSLLASSLEALEAFARQVENILDIAEELEAFVMITNLKRQYDNSPQQKTVLVLPADPTLKIVRYEGTINFEKGKDKLSKMT